MVVDDDLSMRDFLRSFLTERGYQAVTLADPQEAIKRYDAERPAAVILDVVMPGAMDGLAALAALKRIDREVPVIVVSGQGRTATVVQAMKLGASDFVSKPFQEGDLEVPLANALKQRQLSREVASLREQLQHQGQQTLLFGNSERMVEVRDLIERVADTDVTVLIRGESGTGKELVARAISAASLRHDKPFVKVNCAALPTELLESELFGFERGAFTGAIQHKPGRFEFANHGTMFLDEIGDMSAALQAKLLQVLQDGEFSRLGGKHDVRVDVRVIAATNRDLERAVACGQFREDLFFRLNVVCIMVPALRDRRDEIPKLIEYFLKKYSVQYNKPFSAVSSETTQLFMDYDWPGNVRELENLIKRVVVLGTEGPIRKEMQLVRAAPGQRLAGQRLSGQPPDLAGRTNRSVSGTGQSALASGRTVPDVGQAKAASQPSASVVQPLSAVPAQRAYRVEYPSASPPSINTRAGAAPNPVPPVTATSTAPLSPASLAAAAANAGNYSLKDISRTAAREAECELILRMLHQTRWNRKATAEILGISYKALLYKIKENGLDKVS
jgi:two-component system response regulator AtoC